VSQRSSGLTRAVVPTGDDLARARRRRWWWALLVVVLLVGAVLAGQALWDWYFSAGDIMPGQPIPA
jgi:uncharacterized protein involved in exopolysaccharide biosynthesis